MPMFFGPAPAIPHSRGVAIIYVSHRMDEIARIADRATILRDGKHVITAPLADLPIDVMIEHIVGKRSKGLVGLLGSGRSALARVIAGIDPAIAGDIRIKGQKVAIRRPSDAIANGIALVPEARATQGIIPAHSVADNMVMSVLDRTRVREIADKMIDRLSIKAASRDHAGSTLSGGNQQKVVIGKWLATEPEILILDEPTAGSTSAPRPRSSVWSAILRRRARA
jgi:ribose transport system ATP-binding protein